MKNPFLIASSAILALGAIAFSITNPSDQEYQKYATEEISLQLQEHGCEKIPTGFSDFLKQQCRGLIEQMKPDLQEIVAENTERKNFVLFSIYVTDFTLPQPLPSYHFETLGLANNFITLKGEQKQ